MLRDWSDEWKNARLVIEIRDDELFQGETVSFVILATVSIDTSSTTAPLDATGTSNSEPALPKAEAQLLALEQLEERWHRHCDGALVDLKVVEPTPSNRDKSASQSQRQLRVSTPLQPQQPRTTLFHQESRLVLLPVEREGIANMLTTTSGSLKVTLVMRCECTLRVRAEFWQRPLTLIARVTPNASREDDDTLLLHRQILSTNQPLTPQFLSEEYTRTHILPLLCEQTSEPPNLMRRVEHRLCVAKPLALKMETKTLGSARVAILARATNTHDALTLRVLDLQLHVNQFANSVLSESGEFRVVKSAHNDFPVELQPHEQHNFVFTVEPRGGLGGGSSGNTTAFVSAMKDATATTPVSHATSTNSQQSLITLSWETVVESPEMASRTLLQPITEHHMILWSPHVNHPSTHSSAATTELLEWLPKPPLLTSTNPERTVETVTGAAAQPSENVRRSLTVVHRGGPLCPLRVTIAPLDATLNGTYRAGVVETLCVIVSNAAQGSTEYDLSLVVPGPHRDRNWFAFEASHHLGRLRPGTIIRKSLRFVFLRHGCADLNALLLYDHISHTWFLPPSTAAKSSGWEVVVRHH